ADSAKCPPLLLSGRQEERKLLEWRRWRSQRRAPKGNEEKSSAVVEILNRTQPCVPTGAARPRGRDREDREGVAHCPLEGFDLALIPPAGAVGSAIWASLPNGAG